MTHSFHSCMALFHNIQHKMSWRLVCRCVPVLSYFRKQFSIDLHSVFADTACGVVSAQLINHHSTSYIICSFGLFMLFHALISIVAKAFFLCSACLAPNIQQCYIQNAIFYVQQTWNTWSVQSLMLRSVAQLSNQPSCCAYPQCTMHALHCIALVSLQAGRTQWFSTTSTYMQRCIVLGSLSGQLMYLQLSAYSLGFVSAYECGIHVSSILCLCLMFVSIRLSLGATVQQSMRVVAAEVQ